MKNLTLALLLIAVPVMLLLTGCAAHAATFTSIGSGAESCANWTADYQLQDEGGGFQGWSEQQVFNQNGDIAWVLGFLSGMGYESDGDVLANTDAAGVEKWISNYCTANPATEVMQAAEAFAAYRKGSKS